MLYIDTIDSCSFVCLDCKFHRKGSSDFDTENKRRCPKCGKVMMNMGRYFKMPKITNKKKWKETRKKVQKRITQFWGLYNKTIDKE